MNLKMSKDEFHDTMMMYIIDLARDNSDILREGTTIVFTPEFDDFLRHILQKPLGDLKTVYYREDAKTKLFFRRMTNAMEDKDEVRLII